MAYLKDKLLIKKYRETSDVFFRGCTTNFLFTPKFPQGDFLKVLFCFRQPDWGKRKKRTFRIREICRTPFSG